MIEEMSLKMNISAIISGFWPWKLERIARKIDAAVFRHFAISIEISKSSDLRISILETVEKEGGAGQRRIHRIMLSELETKLNAEEVMCTLLE